MSENSEWNDLVDRHLRGELSESEKERLAEIIDSDASRRKDFVEMARWDTELGEAMRMGNPRLSLNVLLADSAKDSGMTTTRMLRVLLMVAAAAIIVLASLLIHEKSDENDPVAQPTGVTSPVSVARITGLSGALIWTGDRGEIQRDIQVGTELAGGTIEGLAPDSWFELRFHDGSKVMISGTSMLTFADSGQKLLRLREGRLSADVAPQPDGHPMIIHTRTAMLSVLGTQFEVEAELVSTSLNVSEGKVRLRRLSDGSEVDVPAKHVVIADDERNLTPQRVPDSVNEWKTQLSLSRDHYGKWQPASKERPASLKAIPFVPPDFPQITLHLAGLSVQRSDNSPVVVRPRSRFVVRGQLETEAQVFFGIRVSYPNGKFAGMFRGDLEKRQPLAVRNDEGEFEEVYQLDDFTLDPSVRDQRDVLAAKPDDLVLDGVWAFTLTGKPSGLALTEVELVPPSIGSAQ